MGAGPCKALWSMKDILSSLPDGLVNDMAMGDIDGEIIQCMSIIPPTITVLCLRGVESVQQLRDVVGFDFMGPFPERKVGEKRFVLVIIDKLTRERITWVAKGVEGEGNRTRTTKVGRGERQALSDMFKRVSSHEFQGLQLWCASKGVSHEYSPPYHHASLTICRTV